jgi:hypothetical protein
MKRLIDQAMVIVTMIIPPLDLKHLPKTTH